MSGRRYPQRPMVGVGVAVLRGDSVLLVRRGQPPAAGEWSLPGGAQELGETVEAAARRELFEETGLTVGALQLAAIVDSIHRDAAGAVEYHHTIVDFAARHAGGEARAASDVTEIDWAPLDALASFRLWDEAHRVIGVARTMLGQVGDGEPATPL